MTLSVQATKIHPFISCWCQIQHCSNRLQCKIETSPKYHRIDYKIQLINKRIYLILLQLRFEKSITVIGLTPWFRQKDNWVWNCFGPFQSRWGKKEAEECSEAGNFKQPSPWVTLGLKQGTCQRKSGLSKDQEGFDSLRLHKERCREEGVCEQLWHTNTKQWPTLTLPLRLIFQSVISINCMCNNI